MELDHCLISTSGGSLDMRFRCGDQNFTTRGNLTCPRCGADRMFVREVAERYVFDHKRDKATGKYHYVLRDRNEAK